MTNYWNSHENIRKKQNSWSSIIGSAQQHGAQIGVGEIDIRSINGHHHHDNSKHCSNNKYENIP
jgi:hypothetical protein